MHAAGVPAAALHLVPGDGKIGAMLVADRRVAGVVFTGSTEVGRAINRALAAKDGPIVPLIAETGGINAMIVDATALPEQVTDDVITSAFRSAGQRCSALRLLCVQDDVADRVLDMVAGATRELKLGDPRDPATHVGPVIDTDAKDKLDRWIAAMESRGAVLFRLQAIRRPAAPMLRPAIVELDSARELKEEVFGPVLHVVRWRAGELDQLLDDIAANGTALTLGIHSRIGRDRCAHRRAPAARQCLCEPQYDRRRRRFAAVRRQRTVRDRAEGRRPALCESFHARAGGDREYRGLGRQRHAAVRGRVRLSQSARAGR